MDRTSINTIKIIAAFAVMAVFYSIIISLVKPLFPDTSVLVYISIGILLALAVFIMIPFLIFQFRGKE